MNSGIKNLTIIGIDFGATKILIAKVSKGIVTDQCKIMVPKNESKELVLQALYSGIDQMVDDSVVGIGIGVPSIVDVEKGIVYDVQNIPSWTEVHLKDILEKRYGLLVNVNNDANCFAVGEKYFGKGIACENFAGVVLGTGIAAGLIINNKLYNGSNCGAGEFGMIPYKDKHFEYYASGQFFQNVHHIDGETVFNRAEIGEPGALKIFEEFGHHVGHAINSLLYVIDPEVIILGGSIAKAYKHYKKALWESIGELAYKPIVERLQIELSMNIDIAVLGAAALYYDSMEKNIISEY